MASKDKTSWAQFRVGILGIVALFFVVLLIFLLTGNIDWFQKKEELHVYLSDAAGLGQGNPVRINGIQAGKVNGVALSGETNPARIIRVDFKVEQDMLKQIPSDSIASVGSDNLLGSTKFLEIDKGTKPDPLQPGATMKAEQTQQFDQLVKQGFGVLDSAQAILVKIQDILSEVQDGRGTVGKLLVDPTLYNTIQNTVAQVQELANTLNSKKGTIGHLINDNTLYDQAASLISRIDSIAANLQKGQGSAGKLLNDTKIYDDLDNSVQQLNTLMANLNAGKGTAGQLLKDDRIATQLSSTLDKVNLTIDKVNSGQGTIGQLMVNPQLYDSLTGSTRELQELLKAFRANPKKYLSIKVHIF